MQVLVTGVAGFIGFHLTRALRGRDIGVVGVDNLTPYYDAALKRARLDRLSGDGGFTFIHGDISGRELFATLRERHPGVTHIVHLAAQPGVRHSALAPEEYVAANIAGQLEVLEYAASLEGLEHLVYASSSSVYGGNERVPFHEDDPVENPLSFYGVTKRSGELMAQHYARRHGMPVTAVRPFTSYGPFGRPDMAYYHFTQALYAGEEITLYHNGEMKRDFTYIDDMVDGIMAALGTPPPAGTHRLVNLGNSAPESVNAMLACLEELTGRKARIRHAERESIEPLETFADIARAQELFGFQPKTRLNDGLARFVAWFCDYHGVS